MRDEFNSLDDATIDRLVDGELAADERRRLLASLDDRPGGWRQCALAFLEAQTWRSDFGPLARERSQVTRSVDSAPVAEAAVNRNTPRSAGHWLALAASALVAFGLGTMWRNEQTIPTVTTVETPGPDFKLANDNSAYPSTMPAASLPDALTLWVRDHTGAPQRLHVPLVDAGTVDRRLGVQFRSALPDSLRARLRENGYDVHSTRRYAPFVLENGGSLVVPVEDTRIVPVSADVY